MDNARRRWSATTTIIAVIVPAPGHGHLQVADRRLLHALLQGDVECLATRLAHRNDGGRFLDWRFDALYEAAPPSRSRNLLFSTTTAFFAVVDAEDDAIIDVKDSSVFFSVDDYFLLTNKNNCYNAKTKNICMIEE